MTRLDAWNQAPETDALPPVLACCGSQAFATGLVRARPFDDMGSLLARADEIWWSLGEQDWLQAFACHPRIGESPVKASTQFSAWSQEEQSGASSAPVAVVDTIFAKNRAYEARHGFLYIVCASGKSAGELLDILDRRIGNTTETEICEAAEQQRQITHIRIRKWLTS